MSEVHPEPMRRVSKRAIGAVAVVMLAGCGGSDYGKKPDIPRCFDKPQAPLFKEPQEPRVPHYRGENFQQFNKVWRRFTQADKRWQDVTSGRLPALTIPVHNGLAEGDPIYLPPVEERIDKSIVAITTSKWSGSGFLTTDQKGREVVVTAAHVVSNAKLNALTITGENRVSTHPSGGCYIYENEGHFKKLTPDNPAPVEFDIAILRLQKPLGRYVLKLSSKPAQRGQWVEFANYQGLHEPGNPAHYTGVVISKPSDFWGLEVLNGVEKLNTPVTLGELEDSQTGPGASGGAVVNLRGKVVGISVGSDKDGIYTGREALKDIYNVRMPGAKFGDEYGFVPVVASLVPSATISKALRSKKH
jgi:S1-C subfamily serine protease